MDRPRVYPCRRCSHTFFLLATVSLILGASHLRILHAAAGHLLLPGDDNAYRPEEDGDRPRVYIVHLLPPANGTLTGGDPAAVEAWHKSFLPTPILRNSGKPRLVHSYTEAITGFAAWLRPSEVEAMRMRQLDGFVDAQPDQPLLPETTHTPKFLRLENRTGLWRSTNRGEGRLIGVIDSNIDPNHVSFAGAGMTPPPGWAGRCDFRCAPPATCTCTGKLLGATIFNTPRKNGTSHGTMVASIAAGDFVAGAKDHKFSNYARGTASGASPGSYLSFYSAFYTSTFLAAVEQAVRDRVDVLSISLTLNNTPAYHKNVMAIGTLRAVEQGILVAMAAGNYGPRPASMRNDAPWLLTVGASTHDRAAEMAFYTAAGGGGARNRRVYYGATQFHLSDVFTGTKPLVYPGEGGHGGRRVETCNNTLGGGKNVRGAIVLCWRDPTVAPFSQAETVRKAGGLAVVLMNDQMTGDALDRVPYLNFFSVVIKHGDALDVVKRYSFKNRGAVTARFWPSKSVFNVHPCPVVADFSSRGPGEVTKGVLKPDVLGPGVNILGARAGTADQFNVQQGTSFATPHLAAVAALLKSRHPGWSPAAIRSAIMTTADVEDVDGNRITSHTGKTASFYDAGAGLVNPERADDPGLVYDITDAGDYVRVLCSLYTQAEVNKFARVGRVVDCAALGKVKPEELNYPSVAITLVRGMGKKVVHRTVTNVGPAASQYDCSLEGVPAAQVWVRVTPCRLAFNARINEASFMVEAELAPGNTLPRGTVVEGFLKWTSVQGGGHVVRSPLALIVQ